MRFQNLVRWRSVTPLLAALAFSGCETTAGNVALGVGVLSVYGARSPSNELVQIYYLGVLDPVEQLPQTIYRVTVRGQASAMSNMHFASGWVPAMFIDSLNTRVAVDPQKGLTETNVTMVRQPKDGTEDVVIDAGRRLVLFGPEGFREAPREHRLVIVMGQSPENFFNAIDQALGSVSEVQVEQNSSKVQGLLIQALLQAKTERAQLLDYQLRVQRLGKD